jgi:hypothetical protein
MKYYNFQLAHQIIEQNKENLQSASLGMYEDWFWTAETVWEDGEYKKELFLGDLQAEFEKYKARRNELESSLKAMEEYGHIQIAGISCSMYATPTLQLVFKDGDDKMIPVYVGESEREAPVDHLGVLSGPVQANITPLSTP